MCIRDSDEGDEELGQVGGQSGGVDAGHSQVGKAHVVQHLGCVGVQDLSLIHIWKKHVENKGMVPAL